MTNNANYAIGLAAGAAILKTGVKDAFRAISNLRCEMASWGFEFLIFKFNFFNRSIFF